MRQSWDDYFMSIAYAVSERSTCKRRKVGAVAVRDNDILATGYNGAPHGIQHFCEDAGCLRESMNVPSGERHELCYAVHAEQNVIIRAAKNGIMLKGCTLYCTTSPCVICAKMLINVGVKTIITVEDYPDPRAKFLLDQSDVVVRNI